MPNNLSGEAQLYFSTLFVSCLAVCWFAYRGALRDGCLVNRIILMIIGAVAGGLGYLIWSKCL